MQNIYRDLRTMGITWDKESRTSDHFGARRLGCVHAQALLTHVHAQTCVHAGNWSVAQTLLWTWARRCSRKARPTLTTRPSRRCRALLCRSVKRRLCACCAQRRVVLSTCLCLFRLCRGGAGGLSAPSPACLHPTPPPPRSIVLLHPHAAGRRVDQRRRAHGPRSG